MARLKDASVETVKEAAYDRTAGTMATHRITIRRRPAHAAVGHRPDGHVKLGRPRDDAEWRQQGTAAP